MAAPSETSKTLRDEPDGLGPRVSACCSVSRSVGHARRWKTCGKVGNEVAERVAGLWVVEQLIARRRSCIARAMLADRQTSSAPAEIMGIGAGTRSTGMTTLGSSSRQLSCPA